VCVCVCVSFQRQLDHERMALLGGGGEYKAGPVGGSRLLVCLWELYPALVLSCVASILLLVHHGMSSLPFHMLPRSSKTMN
jgi:hypothetical protein